MGSQGGVDVIHAPLNYFLEVNDGGTDVIYPGTAIDKLRKLKEVVMPITDVRNSEKSFNLDTHGFQFISHPSEEQTFDDVERVKSNVYQEVAELMKKVTGASRVIPFSHLIRNNLAETAVDVAKKSQPTDIIPIMTPSLLVHIDQSYEGAKQVLAQNVSVAEADKLSQTRWAVINLWRPIGSTVRRDALAMCDAKSCPESDLRIVYAQLPSKGDGSKVSKGKGFEVFNVAHNSEHKWYFASEMTPDEAWMIKCFDSKLDGRARRVPHTAFQAKSDYGPPRTSIEVRCLVFWEDQTVE